MDVKVSFALIQAGGVRFRLKISHFLHKYVQKPAKHWCFCRKMHNSHVFDQRRFLYLIYRYLPLYNIIYGIACLTNIKTWAQLHSSVHKHFKEYYLASFCWWIPSSCENHCNLVHIHVYVYYDAYQFCKKLHGKKSRMALYVQYICTEWDILIQIEPQLLKGSFHGTRTVSMASE